MVLALSVVSFLYLNLKSVHSFAFLGSVAYKNMASEVIGIVGRNSDTTTQGPGCLLDQSLCANLENSRQN